LGDTIRSRTIAQLDARRGPLADFIDQGHGIDSIEGLGVEQFVVSHRDCVLGQGDEAVAIDWKVEVGSA